MSLQLVEVVLIGLLGIGTFVQGFKKGSASSIQPGCLSACVGTCAAKCSMPKEKLVDEGKNEHDGTNGVE